MFAPRQNVQQRTATSGRRRPVDASTPARRPTDAPTSRSARRIAALDGLRGIAIIGVVLYHTRPSILPGGFLGVTLFFVITGFLITRSVTREVGRTGTFAYGRYLLRRVARLLPPVLATIALAALGTYLLSPSLLPKVQADALPAATFTLNWSYIFREVSYFAAAGLPSPLTHLWYLGVTFQCYLVLPLALVAMIRGLRTRRRAIVVTSALAAVSSLLMAVLFDPAADTARVYYGTDTRAAEVLLGAVCALALPLIARARRRRAQASLALQDTGLADGHRHAGGQHHAAHDAPHGTPAAPGNMARAQAAGAQPNHTAQAAVPTVSGFTPIISSVIAAVCLIAFIVGFFLADGESPVLYRGGYLIAAVVAALLVACVQQPGCLAARPLAAAPLTWLGSRSFSLYLVHYPLLTLMNPATRTTGVAWWEWLVQFAIILAVTEVFYRAVEKPSAAAGKRTARFAAAASCTVLALMGAVVTLALAFAPLDWQAIASARATALRPELAGQMAPEDNQGADGPAANTDIDTITNPDGTISIDGTAAQEAGPVAEKVPENLPWQSWSYDEQTGTCSARALVIGDSVTAGATPALQAALPQSLIDGQVSRQLYVGQDVYAADVAGGFDPEVVIFALGGNSLIRDESQVQALIDAVGGKPVYFVTIRSPYPLQDANNEVLRRYAEANANVGIIDWCGASEGRSEYLVDDGQHLTDAGCTAFAQLIRQALCGR